jgi:hypothetical protein
MRSLLFLLKIHQEENKQKQDQIKLELNRILVRQKELEENNERLLKHENEIKKEIKYIDALNWTNEEYEFMSRRDEDLLTIREFAAVGLICHSFIFFGKAVIFRFLFCPFFWPKSLSFTQQLNR